ncbi:MAG: hypothetical protein ABS61_10385 [Microbacterium sp. SCN 70-18]|nr:DUF222 domain-containing protein [Microbacterium chocolatum]ODT10095.1 MAG: hypothetical protein ABS61_10385 [Microbacterium sp. SCN 70-18]
MDGSGLEGIAEALAAVVAAGGGRPVGALTPGELLGVLEAFGALKRQVDAGLAPVAAEVARQSRRELGGDSLARRAGFSSAPVLVATTVGTTVGEAVRWVQVGEATAPRTALTGEALPAKHPHVARAVAGGTLGMTGAAAITALLDRVALRVDPERLERAEEELVGLVPGLRPDQLSKLLARAEAHLDPDGVAPRHEDCVADRSFTLQERDGMLHLSGKLDAETGAPVKAAIEAIVGGVLRRNEHADTDAGERDPRSVKQIQADALADLCRHAIGCTEVPTGPQATIVVRVDLADLEAGTGAAIIDGVTQPIPAGAVRRLAADAQVIPCVLGGDSEILDWGRTRRLFSAAQKLALVERDGGCVSCGAPPAWCHVHHVSWWKRDSGPTDLGNGVLLCTGCHHRLHADGWDIHIDGTGTHATVWLIPPPWIDPHRTPRATGTRRYTLTA